MSPILKHGCAKRPSTIRLLAYMAASGIACGCVWYVAFVLGVVRLDPAPHEASVAPIHAFNFKGAI
jgi:hypothetical protein